MEASARKGTRYAKLALAGDFTVETVGGYLESDETLSELQQPPAGVEGAVFKAAMRTLPSGVVMVTTRVDGRPWGLTISACCSLTLEPPQILVSLREATVSCREIVRSGRFGVSILGSRHKGLAKRGSAVGVAKFIDEFCEAGECGPVESPIISGALYHLDCAVADTYHASDHIVFLGLVTGALAGAGADSPEPLLYFNGGFWRLGNQLE
jgi:flavin reductase (DIM6/NTAB) family NADH-FMN oxidoreductase RutF